MTLYDVLSHFDKVKQTGENQYIVRCPCHEDNKNSLSIGIGDSGKILMRCQAGCRTEDILKYSGLTFKDLANGEEQPNPILVATYDYRYPDGTLAYQKLRYIPKNFKVRKPDGNGGWIYNRKDIPPLLYEVGNPSERVFVVEGEKDADRLGRLGFYVVSPESGASKFDVGQKWKKEYSERVKDKIVRIIQDNDVPGINFANHVANILDEYCPDVKVFDLTKVYPELPEKGDVSDLIEIVGEDKTKQFLDELEQMSQDSVAKTKAMLPYDNKGRIVITADTFLTILRNDDHFSNIYYDVTADRPIQINNGTPCEWKDEDDSLVRNYIERTYQLSNHGKLNDAFAEYLVERRYNPIAEEISKTAWDGKPRCEEFFIRWLKCDDTPYNREVARLLFAGGISRAFNPGCKVDSVAVLIGAQGGGKSTICQWLALEPRYYHSLSSIYGTEVQKQLRGKFVVELEEMLATLSNGRESKTTEAVKGFITTPKDDYRDSYGHRSVDHPRSCIFVGTTNQEQFLTDLTGNRRWYPIRCKCDAGYLFAHEKECKVDIRQAWAEMLHHYKNNDEFSRPVQQFSLSETIRTEQESATEDDWRTGVIAEFLVGREVVCIKEIYDNCIDRDGRTLPTSKDSRDIGNILTHKLGWRRTGNVERFSGYGSQKSFRRDVVN